MKDSAASKSVTVLYVEDEESDVFFMRRAFEQAAPEVRVEAVADGQQALDYLAGRKQYQDRAAHALPALVLLDLNLPGVSGFEVLKWMRQQTPFQNLPVVVFSSSSLGRDKQGSDDLGANAYLEKPASASQFRRIADQIKKRWLAGSAAAEANPEADQSAVRMKKLVQNKSTKAFLSAGGAWTTDCQHAQVFPKTEVAREAVRRQGLKDVELYYLFGELPSDYDFTISLLP